MTLRKHYFCVRTKKRVGNNRWINFAQPAASLRVPIYYGGSCLLWMNILAQGRPYGVSGFPCLASGPVCLLMPDRCCASSKKQRRGVYEMGDVSYHADSYRKGRTILLCMIKGCTPRPAGQPPSDDCALLKGFMQKYPVSLSFCSMNMAKRPLSGNEQFERMIGQYKHPFDSYRRGAAEEYQ